MTDQPEDEKIHQRIREVYNSGNCARAVEMSTEFLRDFPDSLRARYAYAVMHGDYSYDPKHSEAEKQRLLEIAKTGVSELFNDPNLGAWSEQFQRSVKNEYYWFFELHLDQHQLGLDEVAKGNPGHYSACVGASMLAFKKLDQSLSEAEHWAKVALEHFEAFERYSPTWYNINYFGAQALACLGRYDEALACYKDMYRKQGSAEKENEISAFLEHMAKIKSKRNKV